MPAQSHTNHSPPGSAAPSGKTAQNRWAQLARITRPVVNSVPLAQQMQTLTAEVRAAFAADACVIRALDGETALLLAADGLPPEALIEKLPATYGLAREILQSRRPLVVADTTANRLTNPDGLPAALPANASSYHFRAYAGAPLLLGDRVVGILGVYQTHKPRRFSEKDLEHLQIVANHAAVAVENDRLFRALQNKTVALEAQMREAKQLEAEREILLARAEDRAQRDPLTNLLNHRAFHQMVETLVQKANAGRERATPFVVVGLDIDHFKFFNKAYGHTAGDRVLQTVAETLRAFCQEGEEAARLGGDEFGLLLRRGDDNIAELTTVLQRAVSNMNYTPVGRLTAIPVRISVGAAAFPREGRTQNEVINLADERLRQGKSGSASGVSALSPKGIGGGTQTLRAQFAASQGFALLNSLLLAVDGKDRYSCAHCDMVAHYCAALAHEMQLSEADTQILQITALIHDVGKIGVPESILRSPAALDEAARKIMEQHAPLGGMLAASAPGMAHLAPLIRAHHERWDGSGYPDGLAGKDIPLITRLLSVADAFAAMTTDRPYRTRLSNAAATAELQKNAGTQWDADCVAAFVRTIAAE